MFKRKLIALAIVIVMAVTMLPLTALATNVTSDGGILLIKTELLNVVLPTGNSFHFWLDPIGLLGIDPEGPGATPGELIADGHAGKIVFPENFAPTIENRSSVDVDIGVVMGAVVIGTATSVTTALDDDSWNTSTETDFHIRATYGASNAFLTAAATETSLVGTGTSFDSIPKATEAASPTSYGSYTSLYLGKANYLIQNTNATDAGFADIKSDLYKFDLHPSAPTLQGAQFTLDGRLSVEGDWQPFKDGDSKMALEFFFAFDKNDDPAGSKPNTSGNSFGYVAVKGESLFASKENDEPLTPPATIGFAPGDRMSAISNVPFTDTAAGGIEYKGQATFTYNLYTSGPGPKVFFNFVGVDLADVAFWFYPGSGPNFENFTSSTTIAADGVTLGAAFGGVEAGNWIYAISIENADGTFDFWKINAVVQP